MLPTALVAALRAHLREVHAVWQTHVPMGQWGVELPHALEHKYQRAGLAWAWSKLYTHVLKLSTGAVRSPLDALLPALAP